MASELASILLGGVLTLSGTFFVHAYQRHIERKRLCSALSVEIRLMEEWFFRAEATRGLFDENARRTLENFANECANQGIDPERQLNMSYSTIVRTSKDLLKTDIYEANRGRLGILTSEQAAKTICFYEKMAEFCIHDENVDETEMLPEDKFHELRETLISVREMRKMQQQTLEALDQSIWEMYNPFRNVTYYPVEGGLFPDKDDAEYVRWKPHPPSPEEESSSEEIAR